MVSLDGGEFLMGDAGPLAYPGDGEGPVRHVRLDVFGIDPYAVSNARFAEFVGATGHVTTAERAGWSFVFGGLLPDDFPPTRGVARAPWWCRSTRGGSYLCHASYCRRYRVSARNAMEPESTTGNTGFRCARDVGKAA